MQGLCSRIPCTSLARNTVDAQAIVRMFDFATLKWDTIPMPDCLSAGHTSLLAAHDQELVLFGKYLPVVLCWHLSASGKDCTYNFDPYIILQAGATLRGYAKLTMCGRSTQAALPGSSTA